MKAYLDTLRAHMREHNLDAWLVTGTDPFASEYPSDHWREIAFLTGFTGSYAQLLITHTDALLWTDSRYWIQAAQQTDCTLMKAGLADTPSPVAYCQAQGLTKIGVPQATTTHATAKALQNAGLTVSPTPDWVDALWVNRPELANSTLRAMTLGLSIAQKLAAVRARMQKQGIERFIITDLCDLAWLTNARGADVTHTPVFCAYGLLTLDSFTVCVQRARLSDEVNALWEEAGIEVIETLPTLEGAWHAQLSSTTLGIQAEHLIDSPSPITAVKAIKHPQELLVWRQAFVADGVALTEFYAELDDKLAQGQTLTEMDLVERLHWWRSQQPDFLDESFSSIVAFGPNAALPHYQPSAQHNATLTRGVLLIDSGGQYRTGTTDITRMSLVGYLTPLERQHITLVLKAHIALAMQRFPVGAQGAQLDAIARAPLWQHGLDFGHGTGHGVGFQLSVHEGPFSVSPRAHATGDQGLQAGRLFSNEPGFYLEGSHGVRWENLVVATPVGVDGTTPILELTPMTLAAFDLRTIDATLLTPQEKAWLKTYHTLVHHQLSPYLSERACSWLERVTALN